VSDFSEKVPLGRTSLDVARIGIGSAYGPSPIACRKAFDAGVNYFFWGSIRTAGMGVALRDIAQRHRDEMVIALETYARSPWMISKSIDKGLRKLNIGRADVLLLGWHDTALKEKTLEIVRKLQEAGRFRFLAVSSHQRPLFQKFLQDEDFDVFHIRYNAAHPGAEQDIFPYLPKEKGPGIVSFTNTRWGHLLKEKYMPDGMSPPTAADCYRFVLSDPHVHVAISGPKNDDEMETALSVLRSGPMDESELERMRTIGEHVHGFQTLATRFA